MNNDVVVVFLVENIKKKKEKVNINVYMHIIKFYTKKTIWIHIKYYYTYWCN